jgi:hypothetical protein
MRHATTLAGLALITLLANGPNAPVAAQTVTGSPVKGEVPKALADAGSTARITIRWLESSG